MSDTPIYDQLVDEFWPVLQVPPMPMAISDFVEAMREINGRRFYIIRPDQITWRYKETP